MQGRWKIDNLRDREQIFIYSCSKTVTCQPILKLKSRLRKNIIWFSPLNYRSSSVPAGLHHVRRVYRDRLTP